MKSLTIALFASFVGMSLTPVTANAQYRPLVRTPVVKAVAPLPKIATPAVLPRATAATPPAISSSKPQAFSARPTTPPVVQGNSRLSNASQNLYGIFQKNTTTGKVSLHKYGVSGGSSKTGNQLPSSMQKSLQAPTRDYSNRALQQVKQLNKQAQVSQSPVKYSTRTLNRIPSQPVGLASARAQVLAAEKQAVTKHAARRGDKPSGNALPNPYPFSRIK